MTDLEVLCPKTKRVKLCGREIEIKPLSIKQAVDLWRIINSFKIEAAAVKEGPEGLRLAKILDMAGSSKSKDILNILTGGALKDVSNPQEKISLLELSFLAEALSEVNDFKTLFLNFTQALKAAAGRTRFQTP